MSGLACVTCHKFFRVKKVGVYFEEGMPLGRPQADGDPEAWGPYKLWAGDLAECPGCGAQVIYTGSGQGPIAEHYQPTYQAAVDRYEPMLRVDDCGGKRP